MLGYTHAAVALAAGKVLGLISLNSYFGMALLVFFAVIPDIDIPSSWIGKIFFPFSRHLYSKFGHRNITHSLIFMIFLTAPLAINLNLYKISILGYGIHLLTDMLTYTGIPLFYPFEKNCIVFGAPIITGRWTEIVISILSIIIFVVIP